MSIIEAVTKSLTPDAQLILAICIFALVLLVFVLVVLIISSSVRTRNVCALFHTFTPLLFRKRNTRKKQRLRFDPPKL